VARLRSADLAVRRRAWRQREWPRRAVLGVALSAVALVLAMAMPHLPMVRELEGRSVDARFRWAPLRPPDPRLLLVILDEASLAAERTPLPQLGDETGRRLEAARRGRLRVGIDLLLPETWSRSAPFSSLASNGRTRSSWPASPPPTAAWLGLEGIQGPTSWLSAPSAAKGCSASSRR
jgi:hypothetical protein